MKPYISALHCTSTFVAYRGHSLHIGQLRLAVFARSLLRDLFRTTLRHDQLQCPYSFFAEFSSRIIAKCNINCAIVKSNQGFHCVTSLPTQNDLTPTFGCTAETFLLLAIPFVLPSHPCLLVCWHRVAVHHKQVLCTQLRARTSLLIDFVG